MDKNSKNRGPNDKGPIMEDRASLLGSIYKKSCLNSSAARVSGWLLKLAVFLTWIAKALFLVPPNTVETTELPTGTNILATDQQLLSADDFSPLEWYWIEPGLGTPTRYFPKCRFDLFMESHRQNRAANVKLIGFWVKLEKEDLLEQVHDQASFPLIENSQSLGLFQIYRGLNRFRNSTGSFSLPFQDREENRFLIPSGR